MLLLLCAAAPIFARPMWGGTGHSLTAAVAEKLISERTRQATRSILRNQSMTDVASWADDILKYDHWNWTAPMHYRTCKEEYCSWHHLPPCGNPDCIVDALSDFTEIISSSEQTDKKVSREEALKFVIHFHGDIHQPLHFSYYGYGGNSIKGKFCVKDTCDENISIHAVWDYGILGHYFHHDFHSDFYKLMSHITGEIQTGRWKEKAKDWSNCASLVCPQEWGVETLHVNCRYGSVHADGHTRIEDKFFLGDIYYGRNLPVCLEQIAKGAVRLAATLERIFNPRGNGTGQC